MTAVAIGSAAGSSLPSATSGSAQKAAAEGEEEEKAEGGGWLESFKKSIIDNIQINVRHAPHAAGRWPRRVPAASAASL